MPKNTSDDSTAIQQGPSHKNKALQDLEYILHSLMNVDGAGYKSKEPLPAVILSFNSLGQVMISSDDRKFNLSCALKNANLEYFKFSLGRNLAGTEELSEKQKEDSLLLMAFKEAGIIKSGVEKSKKLNTDEIITIAEEEAITKYTTQSYIEWNAFLRGEGIKPSNNKQDSTEVKKMFIHIMLAISGINKNINSKPLHNVEKTGELIEGDDIALSQQIFYREDGRVPASMLVKKNTKNQIIHHAGFQSYSSKENISMDKKSGVYKTILVGSNRQQTIQHISWKKEEQETLFPPGSMIYMKSNNHSSEDISEFKAQRVWGVVTEKNDHYIIDAALAEAYEYLKNRYIDEHQIEHGINRPNHALAHHVRVVSYTEPVIDYFKEFATDLDFRDFCKTLSQKEINIIKVMLAFSKTGREGECSFRTNPAQYQSYQKASCNNMATFMQKTLGMTEAEITFYCEPQMEMGNPEYGKDEPNSKKIFIRHIIALAHKLDLPRCYQKLQAEEALKEYCKKGSVIINNSEKQEAAFHELKLFARSAIVATGDRISNKGERNIAEFVKCNADPMYCMDQCEASRIISYSKNEIYTEIENIISFHKKSNIPKRDEHIRTLFNKFDAGESPGFVLRMLTEEKTIILFETLNVGQIKRVIENANVLESTLSILCQATKKELIVTLDDEYLIKIIKDWDQLLYVLKILTETKQKSLISKLEINDLKKIIKKDFYLILRVQNQLPHIKQELLLALFNPNYLKSMLTDISSLFYIMTSLAVPDTFKTDFFDRMDATYVQNIAKNANELSRILYMENLPKKKIGELITNFDVNYLKKIITNTSDLYEILSPLERYPDLEGQLIDTFDFKHFDKEVCSWEFILNKLAINKNREKLCGKLKNAPEPIKPYSSLFAEPKEDVDGAKSPIIKGSWNESP